MWSGLIARLAQLQILEGERYTEEARENQIKQELVPPRRGRILDRFGVPLADHRMAGRVDIRPDQVEDDLAALRQIASIVDMSPERIDRVADRIRRNRLRREAFVPVTVLDELSYEEFTRLSVRSAELPWANVEMAPVRSYPRGRDFAHVLGYVARPNADDIARLTENMTEAEAADMRSILLHPEMRTGRSGLERTAETWLRGKIGARRLVTNAAGRIIQELDSRDTAPVPGRDLYTTLDARLQRAAIERFESESGACVVMDIESGDLLAFVSTPAFDPNDFVNGISQADYNVLRDSDRYPLYHKAYDGTYPPGSTYKMVIATAALKADVVNPSERVYCSGRYWFGNRPFSCWKRGGHGSMNMKEALKQSCDVYFYEMARRLGIERIEETSREFGFGQRWELGLTGGRSGLVPSDEWKRRTRGEPWYDGETISVGIGQGALNTTPLQLAVMTARIAKDGALITPRIIGQGPSVASDIPDDAALPPEYIAHQKDGMVAVTTEWGGTARRSGDLPLPGEVQMAGKTGTAQVRYISQAERATGVIKNEDLERRLRDHALFVGYAPIDNPRYAISVIVEHGGGGSRAAAPVARDILAEAIRLNSGATPAFTQLASAGGAGRAGTP